MILNHLSILNYRNLTATDLDFSPSVNCLVGANGMGKSNVLDAIYFLSFCRGFTSAQDGMNLRHGADFFMIEGEYELEEGTERRVAISSKPGSRKRVKVDDRDLKRISEHVGRIPLVMIAPADSALVTGGSEERRKFLDMAIMQYDATYLEALIRYEKSLKQRNALLRQESEPDWGLMDVIEDMMDADAHIIYKARREFTETFLPIFRKLYAQLSGADDEEVGIDYESHIARGPLHEQLRECRAKERIVGYTLHGVHKDELSLTLRGFAVKKEASQGQQKTFFISMKLAQYLYLREKGEKRVPLLLLDDIFDKLDSSRVSRIIDYVGAADFGQTFITDTRREHLDRILSATNRSYKLFEVKDGDVAPLQL